MEEVTITLPHYAVRYLAGMCKEERARLVRLQAASLTYGIGMDASFDSLEQIEFSLPSWVDKPEPKTP